MAAFVSPRRRPPAPYALYMRKVTDHYPDRDPPLVTSATDHIVLCGNLVTGSIQRVLDGPTAGTCQ
jgi:hypothetical protein